MKTTSLLKYKKMRRLFQTVYLKLKIILKWQVMSTNSQKRKFKLVTLSSSEGHSKTTETAEVKTKME